VYDCIKANPGIQVQQRIIASGNLTVDEMNSFLKRSDFLVETLVK
jgi:hypothetical protein